MFMFQISKQKVRHKANHLFDNLFSVKKDTWLSFVYVMNSHNGKQCNLSWKSPGILLSDFCGNPGSVWCSSHVCLQEDELQATAVELRHRSEELKRQTEALQLQVSVGSRTGQGLRSMIWAHVMAGVTAGVTVWVWADRHGNYLSTGQSAGCIGVGTQYQSAAVTPLFNLSFSFLSRIPRHLIYFIAIDS